MFHASLMRVLAMSPSKLATMNRCVPPGKLPEGTPLIGQAAADLHSPT